MYQVGLAHAPDADDKWHRDIDEAQEAARKLCETSDDVAAVWNEQCEVQCLFYQGDMYRKA